MSEATAASKIGNRKSAMRARLRPLLNGLFAEWPKISAELSIEPLENEPPEMAEHRARIEWTNQQLRDFYAKRGGRFARIGGKTVFIKCDGAMVSSWNDLHEQEIRFLRQRMWEATGNAAAWRAAKLREIATVLVGVEEAEHYVIVRAQDRFQVSDLLSLAPAQFKALRGEFQSQIARREVAMDGGDVSDLNVVQRKVEEVRKRFSPQRH